VPVGFVSSRLSFGQFLGRAITIAVLAPVSLMIVPLVFTVLFGLVLTAAATAPLDDPLLAAVSIGGEPLAEDWVLVVPVEGPILANGGGLGPFGGLVAGGDDLKRLLIDAANDDRVRAVVIEVNTPGGSITGSISITDGIQAVQAAGKPVVVYVSELSASGGVWAMAPADTIVASPGALVGSIGVIFGPLRTYTDVVAIDDGLLGGGVQTTGGIDEFYVSAGTGKDIGNPFRPLTDEEQASLQEATDRFYELFVGHVATNRDIPEDVVRQELGAFIFEASRAAELGLVDRLGDRDDAWEQAAASAGLTEYDIRRAAPSDPVFTLLGFHMPWGSEQVADLSGLCGSTARAFAFHGDLGSFCAAAR
jgi:protease IV